MEKLREKLLEELKKKSKELNFHLQEDHEGNVVPTSFHYCILLKQRLRFAEEDLDQFIKQNRVKASENCVPTSEVGS